MTLELNRSEPYTGIAEIYDYMLRHVDYEQWYQFIRSIMLLYAKNPVTVLELGCGTGKFGAKFSSDNYQILGIDRSLSMLLVAKSRAFRNFKIICADIKNFYLKKNFDFIFSVHDTMNYQLADNEIKDILKSVKNAMHSDSIFMFDITTEYNVEKHFNNKTSSYKSRGMSVEWANKYDKKKKYVISSFKIRHANGRAYNEEHIQRIYSQDEIKSLLESEGFEILHICSDYTYNAPSADTIMINFITKKRD
ncbi:MAG: class I SAM-dependent methyltransferase [Leptospirales bacterium]|nr:class I SAM-dependent methyltransferase [Leptospirales bacterium]